VSPSNGGDGRKLLLGLNEVSVPKSNSDMSPEEVRVYVGASPDTLGKLYK
jgi:hypothetical protein